MSKPRFWQRRIAASKMTINHQQPWPIKLALIALVIGLGGAIALWTYDLGRSFAFGPKVSLERMQALQEQVEQLTVERDKLAVTANTIESQQNIEKSTQKQLSEQVRLITAENLKLKDDLGFYESLMSSTKSTEGITVQRIKVEMHAPDQLRYRVLVMQDGKANHDFSGEMQLNLNLVLDGKPVMMQFPDLKLGDAGKLKLSFRHYQKLEGLITIPQGATVKTVQARVLDKGQLRAQQSASL